MVSLIWNIADDVLRDVFLRGQYRDVILPMVVLRRLDALLEPTKEEVDEEVKSQEEMKLEVLDEDAVKDITGLSYFNTSKWTLNRLKSQATDNNDLLYDNFAEYLNGYSENVRDVLKNFDYYTKARKLTDNDRLLAIIERITDPRINLTDKEVIGPDGLKIPALTNIGMGTIFEELLRRFNEENNEEAGEHFTPRDVITLLAHLVFEPEKDPLDEIIKEFNEHWFRGWEATPTIRKKSWSTSPKPSPATPTTRPSSSATPTSKPSKPPWPSSSTASFAKSAKATCPSIANTSRTTPSKPASAPSSPACLITWNTYKNVIC